MRPIVVLGAGSWGTALAIQFARGGLPTVLWGRAEDNPEELARARENVRYLPGAKFPPSLAIEPDLSRRRSPQRRRLVLVVPSSALRARAHADQADARAAGAHRLGEQGLRARNGKAPAPGRARGAGPERPDRRAVRSDFREGSRHGPADRDRGRLPGRRIRARSLAERISSGGFRAYTQSDIVGVEIGGAVKNVLAIATGCSDGLGYGSNSRVFLITRGLAELMRLGVALGAKRETLMGLAGLGDLVLTCTDDQSRNRRFGRALAAGKPVEEAIAEIGQVVEGYHAAKAVHRVAEKHGVDMPICRHVYEVLHMGVPLKTSRRDHAPARSHSRKTDPAPNTSPLCGLQAAGTEPGRTARAPTTRARCAPHASASDLCRVVRRCDFDDVHAHEVDTGKTFQDRERLGRRQTACDRRPGAGCEARVQAIDVKGCDKPFPARRALGFRCNGLRAVFVRPRARRAR